MRAKPAAHKERNKADEQGNRGGTPRLDAAALLTALRSVSHSVASRGPQVTVTTRKTSLTVRLLAVSDVASRQPALLELYRGRTLVRRHPIAGTRAGLTRVRHTFTKLGKAAGKHVVVVRGGVVDGAQRGRLLAIVNSGR